METLPEGWQVALAIDAMPPSGVAEAVFGRQIVVIVDHGGIVRAYQGLCPHQMARLDLGSVEDGWLKCPQHMARFRLTDGVCGPGWVLPPLRMYPTMLHAGQILVPDPLPHGT